MDRPVTIDVIEALNTLRVGARGGYSVSPAVRDAINTLDNADVFVEIDNAAWERTSDALLSE